jgi:hypothetical protein
MEIYMSKGKIHKSKRYSRKASSRKRRRQDERQQFANIISRAKSQLPRSCTLCRQKPDGVGAFIPSTPGLWGAPRGKDRVFLYAMCNSCRALPDALVRVEGKIAKRNFPHVEASS